MGGKEGIATFLSVIEELCAKVLLEHPFVLEWCKQEVVGQIGLRRTFQILLRDDQSNKVIALPSGPLLPLSCSSQHLLHHLSDTCLPTFVMSLTFQHPSCMLSACFREKITTDGNTDDKSGQNRPRQQTTMTTQQLDLMSHWTFEQQ